MNRSIHLPTLAGLVLAWVSAVQAQSTTASRTDSAPDIGWPTYGGDPGGMRYSSARQIDRANVARLTPAWTYRTGALEAKT